MIYGGLKEMHSHVQHTLADVHSGMYQHMMNAKHSLIEHVSESEKVVTGMTDDLHDKIKSNMKKVSNQNQ